MPANNLIRKIIAQAKNLLAVSTAEQRLLDLDIDHRYSTYQENNVQYHLCSIEQIFTFAGTASQVFTTQLPANSRVKFVEMNFDTAVVLATAVKVGVGVSATPSQLLLSTVTVAKNTQNVSQPLEANALFTAAPTTLGVYACATGGTAAGTITSGTIRVVIVYEYIDVLFSAP